MLHGFFNVIVKKTITSKVMSYTFAELQSMLQKIYSISDIQKRFEELYENPTHYLVKDGFGRSILLGTISSNYIYYMGFCNSTVKTKIGPDGYNDEGETVLRVIISQNMENTSSTNGNYVSPINQFYPDDPREIKSLINRFYSVKELDKRRAMFDLLDAASLSVFLGKGADFYIRTMKCKNNKVVELPGDIGRLIKAFLGMTTTRPRKLQKNTHLIGKNT